MTVVPIFVSSTFRDFHGERDALHHRVRPELDAALEHFGASVAFVDLRWGIPVAASSPKQRARTVLTSCAREIERCSPLVIGLIGDYYGWVPGEQFVKRFFPRAANLPGDRSITELELRFALSLGAPPPIVFQRHPHGDRTPWSDDGEGRLDELVDLCRDRASFHDYDVDADGPGGLDEFVETAVTVLTAAVADAVAHRPESAPRTRERASLQGRDDERSTLRSVLRSERPKLVIVGPSGVGKSALATTVVEELADDGWTSVAHRVTQAQPSEADFALTLGLSLGLRSDHGDPVAAIASWAQELSTHDRLVVIVDATEHFNAGHEHDRLRSLLRLPKAVATVVTTTSQQQAETLALAGFERLELGPIAPAGVRRSTHALLEAHGRRLPESALAHLASEPRSGLWLRLATDLMMSVGEEVFIRAADHEDPDQGLDAELDLIAGELPSDETLLANTVFQRAEDQFGSDIVAAVLSAIAVSPAGGIEVDLLADLLGLDGQTLTRLRFTLGSAIFNTDLHSYAACRHELIERAIVQRFVPDSRRTHAQMLDRMRRADGRGSGFAIVHHALHSGSWEEAQDEMTRLQQQSPVGSDLHHAVTSFLATADEDLRRAWFSEVARLDDARLVPLFTQVAGSFESRRIPIQEYRAFGTSLLDSPAVATLRDDPSIPTVGDLLLVASSLALRTADQSAAIELAEQASDVTARHRRHAGTAASIESNVRSAHLYLESFLGLFGAALGVSNCAGAAHVIGDVEADVRKLELPNSNAMLAETLTTRLRLCGRCLTTTQLGSRPRAFEDLVTLRRTAAAAQPGELADFELAEALLRAPDAFAEPRGQIDHLREAAAILESLVRVDAGSAKFVIGLASAKRSLASAMFPYHEFNDEMRTLRQEATALAASLASTDVRDARDLELVIWILAEIGGDGIMHRRTARKHWHEDVADSTSALQAALRFAEDSATPRRLQRASGRLIDRMFPKLLDWVTHDLQFASIGLVGAARIGGWNNLERIAGQHNELLDVWIRAAALCEEPGPDPSDYTPLRSRNDIKQAARRMIKRRRNATG